MGIDKQFLMGGPHIPKEDALEVVARARRRLEKSSLSELPCSQSPVFQLQMSTVQHDQVQIGKLLGEGSFSQVYEIKRIQKQKTERLVLKVLKPELLEKPRLFASCSSDLVREGLILSRLNHPNVLSCRACSPNGIDAYAEGRSASFFLVLERLDSTLKEKLSDWRGPMNTMVGLSRVSASLRHRPEDSLEERIRYIVDLAKAVEYLHSQRIFHRDLKPANVGVDRDGCLKVFDLDACRVLPKQATEHPDMLFHFTTGIGSPRYMAPEIARGDCYNAKGDVYSFGLIAWELLTLKVPYADIRGDMHNEEVLYRGRRPECPQKWPTCVKDLLHQCWYDDVMLRPRMDEVADRIENDLNALRPVRRHSHSLISHHKSSRHLMSLHFLSSQ
eukprot:Nitzschia sp. Nitz4//scaffold453_size6330//4639//5887//NITZ4_009180-RA/size6330-augustus-gene-0.9-mRNA-1//1//CDS//3329552275//1092//frame0